MNSSSRSGWVLTQESFDELLAWLNPQREQAGMQYEDIRNKLVRIFMHRGCAVAEDLADETINRVARKVHELKDYYVGEPAAYFYGVARNVFFDYCKQRPETSDLETESLAASPVEALRDLEPEYRCLEKCLGALSPPNRELILEYYFEKGTTKIKNHKEMALRLGIAVNALRIRMCRLRAELKECMRQCLNEAAA